MPDPNSQATLKAAIIGAVGTIIGGVVGALISSGYWKSDIQKNYTDKDVVKSEYVSKKGATDYKAAYDSLLKVCENVANVSSDKRVNVSPDRNNPSGVLKADPLPNTDYTPEKGSPPPGAALVNQEGSSSIASVKNFPIEGQAGSHIISIKEVNGDKRSGLLVVKFTVTNRQSDNFERLNLFESLATANGQAYYPNHAELGDKLGEGIGGWTNPHMQLFKDEPTRALLNFENVPATLSEFRILVINANGDKVKFTSIPISWK